ncbi:MAG: hypothetical protein ABR616_04280 [Dermatophilaceae bacterium]
MAFGTGTTEEIWRYLNRLDCSHKDTWGERLKCGFTGLGTFVALGVAAMYDAIYELFNDHDDDDARNEIRSMVCEKIALVPTATIETWLNALLSGPTLDEDEAAILKLIECMGYDRLRSEIWPRFGDWILRDVNGDEHAALLVALLPAKLTSFAEWDDDATRAYIAQTPCATLNSLPLDDIKTLLQNLFDGPTLDEDERAIITLIKCMSPLRVQELIAEPGFSVSDFDDEVDGSEWTELRHIFGSMGVA